MVPERAGQSEADSPAVQAWRRYDHWSDRGAADDFGTQIMPSASRESEGRSEHDRAAVVDQHAVVEVASDRAR